MSIVITFEANAREGMGQELVDYFRQSLVDTRKFDGCIEVKLHSEEDSPTTVYMYEEWESKQAYERYLAWRGERGDMEKLMEFLGAEPVIRFFDKQD